MITFNYSTPCKKYSAKFIVVVRYSTVFIVVVGIIINRPKEKIKLTRSMSTGLWIVVDRLGNHFPLFTAATIFFRVPPRTPPPESSRAGLIKSLSLSSRRLDLDSYRLCVQCGNGNGKVHRIKSNIPNVSGSHILLSGWRFQGKIPASLWKRRTRHPSENGVFAAPPSQKSCWNMYQRRTTSENKYALLIKLIELFRRDARVGGRESLVESIF